MRKTNILLAFCLLSGTLFGTASAQTATTASPQTSTAAKYDLATGEVVSIGGDRIVVKTKDGAMLEAAISDKTEYKKLAAENPSLKTATAATLSDIGVGDKIAVVGIMSADKKNIPAHAIYLMTKSDIAQKQNKEREEWRTRGITGQVSAVNAQTKEITISPRGGFAADKKIVLTAKDGANFLRYATNSVDYNEAKNGSFEDIKVGDTIRALGDKSEDGSTFKAEKIISGSFQTVGGTITKIDQTANEITINNIQTKKEVTIALGKNSILKQFPAEMAQRMAQLQSMRGGAMPTGMQQGTEGGGTVRPPRPASQAGEAGSSGQTANQGGQASGIAGGMRGGSGNIDDMLDRFPTIAISDLKVGDMIAVSSTKTDNADRINAIKLLSGVEPFLKAAQQTAASGGRNGNRGGQDTGFQIPGLDGGGSNFP